MISRTDCQSLGCFRVTVSDLTEMRPNVLMEAGYMFGCGHDNADMLFVGQVRKSPTMSYGARVLQYENATDLEVAVHEWFARRVR